MKKITLSLITGLFLCSNIQAEEKFNDYSYIGFGVETISYKENIERNGKSYRTATDVSSPVYTSGSLINAGKYFDFSIDAASTLSPTQADEKTQDIDAGVVVQKNQFDAMLSDLRILVHYKLNNNHRIVFGPNYEVFSMKRFSFTDPYGNSIPNSEMNQETITTLSMMGGYVYEHDKFSNGGMRVKASALYGQPLSRNASNTSKESTTFNTTNGYVTNFSGYVGFEITKGLEIGFFSEYVFTKKEGGDDMVTEDGETITWPDNELETFRYGMNFVWNFSVK